MQPLNYAMLKYFTTVPEACTDNVMEALQDQYAHFKAFRKKDMLQAIMTATTNGLLEETRCELDDTQQLRVYFKTTPTGENVINQFIR
ncbi:MAG: hypothetical protein ACRC5A_07440 [Enterobacteriaceae bacterium]